jgi:hypothetical protein
MQAPLRLHAIVPSEMVGSEIINVLSGPYWDIVRVEDVYART